MRQVYDMASGEFIETPDDPSEKIIENKTSINKWQFRKALRATNRMSAFKTYYETLTDEMQDDWQFKPSINIKDDIIIHLKQTMNITDNQMQNIFNKAAEF